MKAQCSYCQNHISYDISSGGKVVDCPHCMNGIVLPEVQSPKNSNRNVELTDVLDGAAATLSRTGIAAILWFAGILITAATEFDAAWYAVGAFVVLAAFVVSIFAAAALGRTASAMARLSRKLKQD